MERIKWLKADVPEDVPVDKLEVERLGVLETGEEDGEDDVGPAGV